MKLFISPQNVFNTYLFISEQEEEDKNVFYMKLFTYEMANIIESTTTDLYYIKGNN